MIHPMFEEPKDRIHINNTCSLATTASKIQNFISGEEMGTAVNPKCGACKCGKCPALGHTY